MIQDLTVWYINCAIVIELKIRRMGKDREGKFHPGKGRLSGKSTPIEIASNYASKDEIALEEKYAIDADRDTIEGVPVRHPNRNADKHQQQKISEGQKKRSDKARNVTLTKRRLSVTPEEITDGLSKSTIQLLADYSSVVCISIYMPTHRPGQEVNEQIDPIIFKTSLQQAASQMKNNVDPDFITRVLEPAYQLLRNEDFWNNQSAGLAFFIAEDHFKFIRLSSAPEQKVWVNNSFLISPLVPFMVTPEYFYLLVISKKQSKLFRADNFTMRHIGISELPNGIDDVVHLEEKDDQKLFRTGSSGAGGGASYHGIGAGKPDEKENISMYLAEVDKTLWQEVLHDERAPLVLAGVEYLIPLYRKVTQYNNIWEEALTGSLEYENERTLYRLSRQIMEPYFQQRTNRALATYGDNSAKELTSSIPEDVIPAAYYSRIAHLFIGKNERLWGTFDKDSDELTIHEQREANDEDLLDKALVQTVLNGGEVHLLDKDMMPGNCKLAALMRY